MKSVLSVILFLVLNAFAVSANGSFGVTADGSISPLGMVLMGAATGSFNADSVMAAEAEGADSCEGDDCEDDDDDCEGEDCEESEDCSEEDSEDCLDSAAVAARNMKNVPLPRQTAYTGKGLSIGLGGGIYNPTEDCDCMGIWQGQLEYFYADWISGGIDVRFFGGDLDSDVMVMYQRYRTNLRFHKAWQKLDIYLESVLAFENTSISELRDQINSRGKYSTEVVGDFTDDMPDWVVGVTTDTILVEDTTFVKDKEACERMLSLDGFSVGVGAGFGLNLTRLWGVTGSVLFEYNFSKVMELSLVPGVAFNLREVWGWAKKNLLSTWIMVEFGAQRYFNNGVKDWANYGLVGIQLGI
ncbi:hypothetical protein [Fibrobacter sp. HC4]|uniref:hypothetical protein n=1 Tax=Fibrobacter sp. HC4 TaxID=3239812 RepID=UPI002018C336|nr:hypothetical protein [Fibrobacter succinogenes]MCL4100542.1 hypothetical protein [Fibrobacter succinogenes]